MHIILNNSSMIPIYEQLVNKVKNEIISGALKESEVLPSVRALSGELRISSLTVKKAYDRLEEEGFVITVHGKGTYVTATDRQLAIEARRKTAEDELALSIQHANAIGLSKDEILEIVHIILEEY